MYRNHHTCGKCIWSSLERFGTLDQPYLRGPYQQSLKPVFKDTTVVFKLFHVIWMISPLHLWPISAELSSQKCVSEVDLSYHIDEIQNLTEKELSCPCSMLSGFLHSNWKQIGIEYLLHFGSYLINVGHFAQWDDEIWIILTSVACNLPTFQLVCFSTHHLPKLCSIQLWYSKTKGKWIRSCSHFKLD